jgi:hypothetical protein
VTLLPRCAAPGAVLVAAVVLGACSVSGTTTIDAGRAEGEIETLVAEAGLTVADVSCPDDVEAVEGGTFDCEVTTDDEVTFEMVVTMTDDEGTVDIDSSADVVVMNRDVMQLAADQIAAAAGEDVELFCPSAAPLTGGTGEVSCTAQGASGRGSVTLSFTDGQLVTAVIDPPA